MTTDGSQQAERLASLTARRSAPTDQRRAVIGKILATGLTSTTVFGITAALGWSATSAATNADSTAPVTEQMVLDLSTGQLVKYVNGVAVSVQQVTDPSQYLASAGSTESGAASTAPLPNIELPANWNPSTPTSGSSTNVAKVSAPVAVDQTAPTAPVEQAPITVADTTPPATTEIVTIPVALPPPTRDLSGGGSGGGGGGGGGSSSGS